MRIGIDASCWSNPRGYGRFTRELLSALVPLAPRDRFVLFADEATSNLIDLDAPNVRTVSVKQTRPPTQAASADGNRSPADMLRFTHAVWREDPDVFFFPSVYTFFPMPPGVRTVVTIHDAIAERFPELTLPSPRARLFWKLKVELAVAQADLIMTVSDFAARDLRDVLGIPPGRIRVSGEAPSPAYRPATAPDALQRAARGVGLPPGARWFIYVGGFNPHKNVDLLVHAHARLAAEEPEHPPHLVLVGPSDLDVFHGVGDAIDQAIRQAGTGGLVHRPGYVPDDTLSHLHTGALALVLPSACEGYGLPAIEAAACGTAVIATRESPLPELLQGAGLWIEPGDEDDLFRAMHTILHDTTRRNGFREVAIDRARRLTWRSAARNVATTLREAAA